MKIKYKKYPKVYENVFTSEGCLKTFTPEKLETDYPGGPHVYMEKFRSFFYDFDKFFFARMVEYYWLQKRFIYQGVQKRHHLRTFIRTDSAYSTFIKHVIGRNYQLFTSTFVFGKIVSYFGDFFHNIDDGNPFEQPELYAFPYKNIGLAHLTLVYQMDERLDLLKEAEEQKMSYYEFLDFIINYTNCVNDETGRSVFELYRPRDSSNFYVKYRFRKGEQGMLEGKGATTRAAKTAGRKPYEYKKYKIETSDTGEHKI
jgi:hypothetical protein